MFDLTRGNVNCLVAEPDVSFELHTVSCSLCTFGIVPYDIVFCCVESEKIWRKMIHQGVDQSIRMMFGLNVKTRTLEGSIILTLIGVKHLGTGLMTLSPLGLCGMAKGHG